VEEGGRFERSEAEAARRLKVRVAMSQEGSGGSAPLSHTRQVTIEALCEHFANDAMGVDEFERRVDGAHKATSSEELKELLRDLPGTGNLPALTGDSPPAERRTRSVTAAAHEKEREFVVAVMGGSTRTGRWMPARTNYAVALMGGAELDFREAVMGPGVTELSIFAVWGGVDVIVPPGMNVETRGIALMGGFDHDAEGADVPDIDAPTLRISGLAVMGGVGVTVRYPGESASDARRRRKEDRREMRRLRSKNRDRGRVRDRDRDDD
jgi:hypothetical protein